MSYSVMVENQAGQGQQKEFDREPDYCPLCHLRISPKRVWGAFTDEFTGGRLQVVYRCPSHACDRLFIANYSKNRPSDSIFRLYGLTPVAPHNVVFSEEIKGVSPSFVAIFNQATAAEDHDLDQVAGMGFRKALEFLIKDFLIHQRPADADGIRKAQLGVCINNYVSDPKLKKCAERAVWLGNDETHYERKYVDQDVNDLKLLIRLTMNWAESELLTEKYGTSITKK